MKQKGDTILHLLQKDILVPTHKSNVRENLEYFEALDGKYSSNASKTYRLSDTPFYIHQKKSYALRAVHGGILKQDIFRTLLLVDLEKQGHIYV